MKIIESIQRAIEFMENHLLEDISIEEIAKEAHMSPYHFQRTFAILTETSVGEYLRRRRLSKAAQELYNNEVKIIEIAFKYGYKTPESFSKAFYKQHGVLPKDVKKGIGNLQSYNRLTIQVNIIGGEPMNYRIVERNAFSIIGVKETFDCSEEFNQSIDINRFWAELGQKGTIDRLLSFMNGEINGLIGATVNYDEVKNQIEYWIGVESSNSAPEGFLQYELPLSKWAVFEVVGPVAKVIPETWKKIYSEWFPSNDFEHSGAPSLEVYKSPDPSSESAITEIWVSVK